MREREKLALSHGVSLPEMGSIPYFRCLHSLLRLFWHGGVGKFRILADQQQHPFETLPVPLEIPARFGEAENGQM